MVYKGPEYQAKYRAENKERVRGHAAKHYAENKEKIKEKVANYRAENKEQIKEYKAKYRAENRERVREQTAKYYEDLKQHAAESITAGKIVDLNKWNMLCNINKNSNKKHPYSEDFTSILMFNMMTKGCFYCGDIATSIDRIDSRLDHTPDNCVGSCEGCNNSKGVADPATFIRKAYYRARGEYVDDDMDIWFVNKNKPRLDVYKKRAERQGVAFELTRGDFDKLVEGNCSYCFRRPTTWFGIDRVIPVVGYIINNVVSCCFDCNVDKHKDDVETMTKRNVRIADRVHSGDIMLEECEKVVLHTGT